MNYIYSATIVKIDKTILSTILYPASFPSNNAYPILFYPILSNTMYTVFKNKELNETR